MTVTSSSSSGVKWRGGLVDDTMGPVESLSEANIRSELAEIAKFRTNRNKGYHWVTHQLKVLVSDEEEDADCANEEYERQDGGADRAYDSDDSADVERYAIELSLQGVESQAKSSTPQTKGHVTSESEVSQCPRCNKYPRFSQRRRTRRFRLVEPWEYLKSGDEYEACDHFVAVSYCWSSYENGSRTCQIRDCTRSRKGSSNARSGPKGKSRDDNVYLSHENGRMPFDEVIDRAVEFASSEGLRCIWIDQACLPQDESEEHQTGVQSMDMVYKRARHTIGLLGCSIASQDELDSLATFFAWGRSCATSGRVPGQDWWNLHFFRQGANGMRWALMTDGGMPKAAQTAVAKQVCREMVDLLQRIIDDTWYTRAWILQESISAGPKLSLLLRVPPGLEYNPSPFMEQDGRLMTTNRQQDSTFILTWGEFDNLRSGLLRMIEEFYDMSSASDMGHGGNNGVVSRILDITSPERIPRPHPKHRRRGIINSSWNNGFVCNAACAIGLLAGRHCLKAEDKTAIVANLCNFEIRLDTFQLAKHFKSLRLCLIALALLNADLSLLVPELSDTAPSMDDMGPLFQVPYANLHKVNKHGVESDDVPRFQAVSQPCLTPGGMMLPAFLWCVDREIDFAPIHFKWAERWWAMKSLRQSNRSALETWWKPARDLNESLRREADRILNNIRRGYFEGQSLRQHKDVAYPNVLFSASVPFTLLQRNAQARFMIGEMVRDILSYLLHSGEKKLADSIWQSLRSPRHEMNEGRLGAILPDEINENMLKTAGFEGLLQLDHTPDAGFAQEWLLDRIVLKGKLWVGHYIPSRTKGSGIQSMQPFSIISNDIYGSSHRVYRHKAPPPDVLNGHSPSAHTLSIIRHMIQDQKPEVREILDHWATRPMSLKNSSVMGRDIVKAALYEELRYKWRSPMAFQTLNSATIPGIAALGLSPSQEALFHYMETYVGWDIDEQESRVHRRMSAFDVDGPCKVATPVDGTRERVPHSEERALSSCWVVDSKGTDVPDAEADWIRKEFVRFRRVVLGGSPFPKDSESPIFSELELQHVPEHLIKNVSALRLKVLRQVHGVWDIIDPAPFQSYLFS